MAENLGMPLDTRPHDLTGHAPGFMLLLALMVGVA